MKKKAHVSYLPMLVERNEAYFPNVLKGGVGFVENEDSAGALNPTREGACAPQKAGGTDMSTNGGQRSARPAVGSERGISRDGTSGWREVKNFVCWEGAKVNLLP